MGKAGKARLDVLLVDRGLADSIKNAEALIMSGAVFVADKRAIKPGQPTDRNSRIGVKGAKNFVSRGGVKLQRALEYFSVSPEGKVCVDCGASAGGFTDCLLKNNARLVYAVDVAYGQLAWSIRNDPRVVVRERTNIRCVTKEMFDIKPQLAVIDVSFISLSAVLPVVWELLTEEKEAIALIKPQFEAKREEVGEKGVVRDFGTHVSVLESFYKYASSCGFRVNGITHSPIKGPEGNIEFLGYLCSYGDGAFTPGSAEAAVTEAWKNMNSPVSGNLPHI